MKTKIVLRDGGDGRYHWVTQDHMEVLRLIRVAENNGTPFITLTIYGYEPKLLSIRPEDIHSFETHICR